MPPYTIFYFPTRGRCEAMRMLLADQGQSWKEEVVTKETWLQSPLKASCVSDCVRQGSCTGSSPSSRTETSPCTSPMPSSDTWAAHLEEGKAQYVQELPRHLKPFETLLSQNQGCKAFIVGDQWLSGWKPALQMRADGTAPSGCTPESPLPDPVETFTPKNSRVFVQEVFLATELELQTFPLEDFERIEGEPLHLQMGFFRKVGKPAQDPAGVICAVPAAYPHEPVLQSRPRGENKTDI
ncbi:glutathione S-transferase P isoform X3 [Vicugna pacos]|uniref:Glutathione S-transferase P isoform X3 n=1 Tax=Vicugna pacos TaxID=30538 RepID=A0ABM5E050_VICPA